MEEQAIFKKYKKPLIVLGIVVAVGILLLIVGNYGPAIDVKDFISDELNEVLEFATGESASTYEWLTHGRTLNRTNYYPRYINNTGFELLWSAHNVSGGRSSPSGYKGVVITTGNKLVSAFNATTGSVIWNYSYAGSLPVGDQDPTIAGDRIYVGFEGGNLSVLNFTSGAHICNFSISELNTRGTPTVYQDIIYYNNYSIMKFNATTCSYLGIVEAKGYYGGMSICNGRGYSVGGAGYANATLHSFNLTTGTQYWNHSYANAVAPNAYPTCANDKIYFGDDDGFFFIINATDGTQVCNYTTGKEGVSSKSVGIGFGMALFESENWTLHSINRTNCNEIWNFSLNKRLGDASPVITSNSLVLKAGYDNSTRLINITDGTEIQNYTAQAHRGAMIIMRVGQDTLAFQNTYNQAQLGNNRSLLAFNVTGLRTLSTSQNAPADAYSSTNQTVNFNCSADETTYTVNNLTLYIDGVSNETNTTAGSSISIYKSVDSVSIAKHNWSCAGVNSENERDDTGNRTLEIKDFVQNSVTWNATANETDRETYILNVSTVYSILSASAIFTYNNSNYTSSTSCTGQECIITNDLDVPLVEVGNNQNKSFFWIVTIYNSTDEDVLQTTSNQQNVSRIWFVECNGTYNTVALNFTTYNEGNLSLIIPHSFDGTFNYWLGHGTTNRNLSISTTINNNTRICISPNKTFYLDGTIEYDDTGSTNITYSPRTYYYYNDSVNWTTTNVSLLLLDSSDSTSFVQEVVEDQEPVPNAYIYTYRYYPGTDEWRITQITRTDSNGKTVGFYEAETALYRHIIKVNGITRLEETEGRKMIPENTPYTITFYLGTPVGTPYEVFDDELNLTKSLSYNNDTYIVTYTYTDLNSTNSGGRLVVLEEDYATEDSIICNLTSSLSSATLTCNMTDYSGSFIAKGYVTRDGVELIVDQIRFLKGVGREIFGKTGLVAGFFLVLVAAMAFIFHPIIGIIAVNLAIILINVVGLVSFGGTFLFGILAVSLILIWLLKD